MPKLSKDFSTGNMHPRETLFATGALAAANAAVQVVADGASSVLLNVTGTYVGTLVVEGSIDNVNWFSLPVRQQNGGAAGVYVIAISSGFAGQWQGACANASFVRARLSAFTSGSATVTIACDNAVSDVQAFLRPSDQHATVTAATATAATLTLPAGAGFFHYITRILIERHTSALLTAGATPTIITTTNLPGVRAFSIPADAAAQGQVYREVIEPVVPIKSSAIGVATTIVAPLTTGVIWRLSADFYFAP
jgi:hypothetical protein